MIETSSVDNKFTVSLQDVFNPDDFRWFFQGKAHKAATMADEPLVRTVDVDNGKKRNALLIIHGYSSSPAVFRYLYPQFKYYDRILMPRLPGHGRSIAVFAKSTANEWWDSADAYCRDLLMQYESVDVMGLSMGGLIATMLAQKYAFRHAYLFAPALDLMGNINFLMGFIKVIDFMGFNHYRSEAGSLHEPKYLELAYRRLPISTIYQILHMVQSFQQHPLKCPADLFLGRYDTVIQNKVVAERFVDDANITTHWLEHSAHVLPLDGDVPYIVDRVNQLSK